MTLKEAYPDRGSSQELQEYLDFVENTREKNGRGEDDHMPKSTHHIIPRSLFKYRKTEKQDDSDRNTIALTHMEHIKAHILLLKYYESTKRTDEEVQVMRMKMANALYATMNFHTTLWSLLDKDILTEVDREYLRTVLYKCRKEYGIGTKVKCYHKTTGKKILVDKSEGIPDGYVEDYRKVDQKKYVELTIDGIPYRKSIRDWERYFGIRWKTLKSRIQKYGNVQNVIDNIDEINSKIHVNKPNRLYFEDIEEKYEFYRKFGKKALMLKYGMSNPQYRKILDVFKRTIGNYLEESAKLRFKIETYCGFSMTRANWYECLGVHKKSFSEYMKKHDLTFSETIYHYVKVRNITLEDIENFISNMKTVEKTTGH